MARALRQAPGPKPIGGDMLSLFLYYRAFRRDPLAWIGARFENFGDTYYARYGTYGTVASKDPEVITDVLIRQPENFCRSTRVATFRLIKRHLGEGLLTSDGTLWKHQRRLMNPAFRPERIESYGAVMAGFSEDLLTRFEDGETRDVHRDLVGLTFRIAVQCLFAHDVGLEGDELSRTLGEFRKTVASPANALPRWFPHPAKRNVERCVAQADAITYALIGDRRSGRTPRSNDLLSMLVDALDSSDPEQSMPLQRLRDEMVTLLIAGHETTSNTCAWALYLLAKHPEIQGRIAEELDAVCRGDTPTTADLAELPYLECVVQETMRIYPAVYGLGRDVAEDTCLAGYELPKHNSILLWTFHAQNDPRWFPDPHRFIPERFEGGRARNIPQGAYAPFGIGARACIGKRFALQEARLILATLLGKYSVALPDPSYVAERHLAATMAPRGGLPLLLRRRPSKRSPRTLTSSDSAPPAHSREGLLA